MVTSNKLVDNKVVKMSEHNNSAVVPQRTLLGEVNEHITCPLCRGYYIDATTIVECLHSFCRSCIIKHLKVKSYCPVCEMMINSAKPNIKLDKALQDIVYKLVPGLFQKEMERRQQFYASRPGPAASATPEQRGEDTERVIFSPEDVISFSLEYSDATDTDSISSKSSDSNEPQPLPGPARRYLQCPAVVNISHLKKFLSMKFDIDSTQFAIDILYKRVPLPDYYTLMDIAYIYNWKRNEPMRFFYQIIDYVAIRNRLFDINRKGLHFRDRKSSPTSTEDTNISSPAVNLNDQASEASSGTDSPMPSEGQSKQTADCNSNDKLSQNIKNTSDDVVLSSNKSDEDREKSQFLNSFELTAKSNCLSLKSSPNKSNINVEESLSEINPKNSTLMSKPEDKQLKRKNLPPPVTPELKKLKVELEKAKISNYSNLSAAGMPSSSITSNKVDGIVKQKEMVEIPKSLHTTQPQNTTALDMQSAHVKEVKTQCMPAIKQQLDASGLKRSAVPPQNNSSPKRKSSNEVAQSLPQSPSMSQKTMPLQKAASTKVETPSSVASADAHKPTVKRIPDLKPSVHMSQSSHHKPPPVNKLRMDLLANNSDPTIDRSKILPQVKCSLGVSNPGQPTGDPLKSLFDSCKLNIPSSLSITLTDQKLDSRGPNDPGSSEAKKNIINKNLVTAAGNSTHKAPSPPVHNYIEILKLPDTDSKKTVKSEGNQEIKPNVQIKTEATPSPQPKPNKSSETSAKGPIPNLKPISDTKLGKQAGNFSSPITFQQTFEQQLQSLQTDKKSKLPKNKAQVPKLVPANPKSLSNVNKSNNPLSKPNSSSNSTPSESKSGTALDLSTAHNMQSQLSSQQTFDKTLETMQSIANLAKKQSLPSKALPLNMTQSAVPGNLNRSLPSVVSPLRIPTTAGLGQIKLDKPNLGNSQIQSGINRTDLAKPNPIKPITSGSPTMSSPSYNIPSHVPPSPAQPSPSPRSQTRSPSSSPKLVIAEDKQATASISDQSINQSNQISSTQLSNMNMQKNESPKASPGPSKMSPKPVNKPLQPGKVAGIWQPLPPNLKSSPLLNNPAEYFSRQYLPKPMDINNANNWFRAQRQYELLKSMSNMTHQAQNDFANKEK